MYLLLKDIHWLAYWNSYIEYHGGKNKNQQGVSDEEAKRLQEISKVTDIKRDDQFDGLLTYGDTAAKEPNLQVNLYLFTVDGIDMQHFV